MVNGGEGRESKNNEFRVGAVLVTIAIASPPSMTVLHGLPIVSFASTIFPFLYAFFSTRIASFDLGFSPCRRCNLASSSVLSFLISSCLPLHVRLLFSELFSLATGVLGA